MIWRKAVLGLQFGALAFLSAALLYADAIGRSSSFMASAVNALVATLRDPATQWAVVLCLVLYFAAFIILEHRFLTRDVWWRFDNANLWIIAFVAFVFLRFALNSQKVSNSSTTLVLLTGAVVGKGTAILLHWKRDQAQRCVTGLISFFIGLLSVAILSRSHPATKFFYNETPRWSGDWDNPNLAGLLMGIGVVLSAGLAGRNRPEANKRSRELIVRLLLILTLSLTGLGLLKSYSRGAWLGTAIGFTYLFCHKVHNSKRNGARFRFLPLQRPLRAIIAIAFFSAILCFWQFRFSEWRPARRVFSAVNVNDFSWRNRVAAWSGALHMMRDRPFFGFGWNRAELVYGKTYLPAQIENGAAIQMNDYFMLGISAGVPALFCFLVYVGLSLRSPRSTVHSPQLTRGPESGFGVNDFKDLDWLQATCRAGAIVLLVGFFFDGGLFKLATGSVFWILLELGRGDVYRKGAETPRADLSSDKIMSEIPVAPGRLARWEVWLRRSAWILGIAAVSESGILLVTPFLGVNYTTLAISRHYLVQPSAVADLNLLTTNVDWSSRKLRPLLQHASLANYNRQLINWKLDDATYRDYVLNPLIDPQRDGQLSWRRSLWEYFYLPIRKENDPFVAAQIVLKFLRQRISIVEKGPVTIEAMWQRKEADAVGFEALKVAAFRSVGIPARLNENGQAEISSNEKWQLAPKEA
jgi:hypothetical protein